ncbi:hypothetical protein [Paracoccus sp. (in: a-proteobacteria)]|uniref:hypothetical protein n=1 Tax=Paracoccus sp. TaxID=267 RepID=UPI003A835B8E
MPTTIEQINSLIGGYTDLKAYYEGVRAGIEDRVQYALSETPNFKREIYVNQTLGDNSATGQWNAPVASIGEAVSRVPSGGLLVLHVQGDYHVTEIIRPDNIALDIRGAGAGKPRITFGWVASIEEPGKIERMAGFQPRNRAEFRFHALELELPADIVTPMVYSHMNGIVAGTQSAHPGVVSIKFSEVDFALAAGSVEATICGQSPAFTAINFQACTFPANFKGRVVKGRGGEGVNPDSVSRFVVTNLSPNYA